MKVKDAMHSHVTWVSPDTSVKDLAKKMRDQDIGAIPIGENDRLIGMVTDRDIVCRGLADGRDFSKLTARDVMTQPILYCHDDDEITAAVKVMGTKAVRRLPVINKQKRMIGMLSLGDISHKAAQELSGTVMKAITAHHA